MHSVHFLIEKQKLYVRYFVLMALSIRVTLKHFDRLILHSSSWELFEGMIQLDAGSRRGHTEVVMSSGQLTLYSSPWLIKCIHSLLAANLKIWKKVIDYRSFEDKGQLASSSQSMGSVSTFSKTLVSTRYLVDISGISFVQEMTYRYL